LQSLFGLGPSADIEILLSDEDQRKLVEVKVDKDRKAKYPLFFDGESVSGKVIFVLSFLHSWYSKQIGRYSFGLDWILLQFEGGDPI
jgi:hypothetical protein